jgi:hypothetical protein
MEREKAYENVNVETESSRFMKLVRSSQKRTPDSGEMEAGSRAKSCFDDAAGKDDNKKASSVRLSEFMDG